MKVFQGRIFNKVAINQINSAILKPALFSAALLFASVSTNAATYNFTDLGTDFNPTAVNNVGQVIGQSTTGDRRAIIWSGGTRTELGTLGGVKSVANNINDSGQVVGYSTNSTGLSRATLWNSATATDLGTFGSFTESVANDINNSGQIVGRSYDASGQSKGVLWQGGTASDTGLLYASAINNLGQIAGSKGDGLVVIQDNGSAPDIKAFSTLSGTFLRSITGINDQGVVLGTAYRAETGRYIFDSRNNQFNYTESYGTDYTPKSINNLGQTLVLRQLYFHLVLMVFSHTADTVIF
jgi:probable HAF family extracellular repeat protein